MKTLKKGANKSVATLAIFHKKNYKSDCMCIPSLQEPPSAAGTKYS